MGKLTPKQERFCREYAIDCNATQAAIRAGYSEKTADNNAHRLMGNEGIKAKIAELQGKTAKKLEITSEFVLGELLKLATVDLSKAYDENGNLKQIHDIPEDVRKAIAGVETYYERSGKDEEGNPDMCTVKKIKFWDKTKALQMLGQHLKLFAEAQAAAAQPIRILIEDYRTPEVKK